MRTSLLPQLLAVAAALTLLTAQSLLGQSNPYVDVESPTNPAPMSKSALACPVNSYAGTISSSDADQSGRITRDGAPTTCDASTSCSLFSSASFDYDTYTFSNPCTVEQCYEVWLDLTVDAANQLFVVAYSGSYNPSSVCTNYLADPGTSYPGTHFSFNVPANGTFVLVVHRVVGTMDNNYTLYIQGLDNIDPTISVALDPTMLWPPNHRMCTINATVTVNDNCPGATWSLTSITSNEPDNGLGDGDTENDIQEANLGTPDATVLLRAERSGLGEGRVYTLCYTAEDASCNTATTCAYVTVPHDMSPKEGIAFRASSQIPTSLYLDQNYPNPVNSSTNISYGVPEDNTVSLKVYDLSGKLVATILNGEQTAGSYIASFDASNLSPGSYVYQLTVGDKSMTRTLVLSK